MGFTGIWDKLKLTYSWKSTNKLTNFEIHGTNSHIHCFPLTIVDYMLNAMQYWQPNKSFKKKKEKMKEFNLTLLFGKTVI